MLFMVTNRRIVNGEYSDEEQRRHGYHYLYDYKGDEPGRDGFHSRGQRAFEVALLSELNRLKDEEGIGTPKVGL